MTKAKKCKEARQRSLLICFLLQDDLIIVIEYSQNNHLTTISLVCRGLRSRVERRNSIVGAGSLTIYGLLL